MADPTTGIRQPIPEQLSLFPTCETVGEAVRELETRLPITTHNELVTALALYHNTVMYGISHPEIFKDLKPS